MKLKVCIVGCGDMGRNHANCWKMRDDAEIVAVCDPMEERRLKMAEDTGATPYADFHDGIMHEGVNAVSVCVPVCDHPKAAIFAAEHGRNVLCEKPIALTLDEADAMIEAARKNSVILSTSFQYRGYARMVKIRQMVQASNPDDPHPNPLPRRERGSDAPSPCKGEGWGEGHPGGAFGGPIMARFTDIREVRPKLAMHKRSMNGGPVVDMAGHYFDLIRYLTGEEPVSVYARGFVYGKGKERTASVEDFAIDAADITVEMTGGHVLNVLVDWGMPEGFGSIGEELVVGPALSMQTVGGQVIKKTGAETESWEAKEGNPPGSSVRINDFADSIQQGRQPEVTGEDGRKALQVSLAALKSIEIGEIVKL